MENTPGLWRVEVTQLHPAADRVAYTITTDNFDVVSGHLAIRREADAVLIAAAPEMLAGLRSCLELLDSFDDLVNPNASILMQAELIRNILEKVVRPHNSHTIAAAPSMLAVLEELDECAAYWSEYDVPLGLHDRIKAAIKQARGE